MADTQPTGKVVRNSTYLTVAYIIQKILSFAYFVFYSRTLDSAGTGTFIYALSFATIFGIVVDLGLSPILVREVARLPERSQKYLSTVLGMKTLLALVGYGGMVLASFLLHQAPITRELLLLTGLVMVIESFSLTVYGVFRGHQNFRYEATGTILHQLVVITIGVIGLTLWPNLYVLGAAVVLGASVNFSYACWNSIRRLGLSLKPNFRFSEMRELAKTALPFFFTGVFTKIYAYIDIVLLGQLTDPSHVGWYSVAYKLTYAIQFLPIAVSNSVYPAYSEAFTKSRERLRSLFEQSLAFMIGLSLPITVAIFFLARPIITNPRLWPTFQESVPALKLSILGLPFIFINLIAASLLNACNRQKINTLNIGITMVVNIVLNLLLIPSLQHVGASIAAVASSVVLFTLNTFWVFRIAPIRLGYFLNRLARIALATGTMWAVISILKPSMSVFAVLFVGVVVYIGAVILFRGIQKDEISLVLSIIRRRPRPSS